MAEQLFLRQVWTGLEGWLGIILNTRRALTLIMLPKLGEKVCVS